MQQPRGISPLQAHNSQRHSNTPHSTILRNIIHRCPSSIAGSLNALDLSVGDRQDSGSSNCNRKQQPLPNSTIRWGRRQLITDNPRDTTWYRRRIKGCRIYHSFNYLLYPLLGHQHFQHLCPTLAIFYPATEKWKWLNNNRKKWKWLNDSWQPGSLMIMKDKGVTESLNGVLPSVTGLGQYASFLAWIGGYRSQSINYHMMVTSTVLSYRMNIFWDRLNK